MNASDRVGDTVLHWAAYGGSELTTRYLLDQWCEPESWGNNRMRAGRAAHTSLRQSRWRTRSVDPDITNEESRTPLHYAVTQGFESVVRCVARVQAHRLNRTFHLCGGMRLPAQPPFIFCDRFPRALCAGRFSSTARTPLLKTWTARRPGTQPGLQPSRRRRLATRAWQCAGASCEAAEARAGEVASCRHCTASQRQRLEPDRLERLERLLTALLVRVPLVCSQEGEGRA